MFYVDQDYLNWVTSLTLRILLCNVTISSIFLKNKQYKTFTLGESRNWILNKRAQRALERSPGQDQGRPGKILNFFKDFTIDI